VIKENLSVGWSGWEHECMVGIESASWIGCGMVGFVIVLASRMDSGLLVGVGWC